MRVNRTFINSMVLLDCLNSVAHIPTLIQFILWVLFQKSPYDLFFFFLFSNDNGIDYICLLEAAYNQMVTAMNRAIPVAIALYR